MATATERADVGYEQARMEGKGPVVSALDAAKNARTGAGVGPGTRLGDGGMVNRGVIDRDHDGIPDNVENRDFVDRNHDGISDRGLTGQNYPHNEGMLGRAEEEFARLRNRTEITRESEPYAPNPNIKDLPKEFETTVQVIQRYPEMKTVEKTDFVKEVRNEERTVTIPKTRVVMDEVERIDRVPVVKEVPQTRIEQVHRVITEDREITENVPVIDYVDVPKVEQVPRVITEEVTERVTVPVVVEVPVTRMVEVPTGNYCEAPVEEIVNPGHAHHGAAGLLHRRTGSNSSSSSDDEVETPPVEHVNADGTYMATAQPRKKRGLLNKILHH